MRHELKLFLLSFGLFAACSLENQTAAVLHVTNALTSLTLGRVDASKLFSPLHPIWDSSVEYPQHYHPHQNRNCRPRCGPRLPQQPSRQDSSGHRFIQRMTAQWMRSPGSGHTQQQGALQAGVTLKTRKVWADSAHWMLYSEEQDLKDIVHHIRLLLLFIFSLRCSMDITHAPELQAWSSTVWSCRVNRNPC